MFVLFLGLGEVFQGVYNEISGSLSYVNYFMDSWNGLLITNLFPYEIHNYLDTF